MDPAEAVGERPDPATATATAADATRRRPWWQYLAGIAVAIVVAAGALVVLASILLMFAVSHGGDGVSNGLSVTNRTGEDLTIVYLASGRLVSNGHIIDLRGTTDLGVAKAGLTTLVNGPSPLERSCTVAPVVARRADGTEAGRLDTGACTGVELVSWKIE